MIYPIYIYGSLVLRTATLPVTPDYPELSKLIGDMFETMYYSEGVGLAAPQVGKSLRLFVIDASPWGEDEPELANFKKVFINAEIYEVSEQEVLRSEGCLSLPGLSEDVSRPLTIKMRYMDENFVEYDETFTGSAARVIQHEYDHIEGRVYTDHLSPLRKTLLKNKLTAMSKGKYKADYKTKLLK